MMAIPILCEKCRQVGVETLADYAYQPEEIGLVGPLMGDPDCWPPSVSGRRLLCEDHFAALSADCQLDYVPIPQGERGGG